MQERDVLRLEDVSVHYGGGAEVLRDISFAAPRGSFHFVVGASGTGKSSLLKVLFLSLRPSAGEVFLFGKPVHNAKRSRLATLRRRIGMVFQDFRLLDHLSIYENVALPRVIAGEREQDYQEDVRALIDWIGLGKRMDAFPAMLSGGEQQRVAIARAVVTKPDLLLADEPTGNVDAHIGRRLLHLFVELNRFGTTVLIATHDPDLQDDIDARSFRLERGRLVVPDML